MYQCENLQICVNDEIALEGLEGITLQALWFRLSERIKLSLPFKDNFKEEIWNFIKSESCFEYYTLPANRPTPQSVSRDEVFYGDPSDPKVVKKFDETYYIYKFQPIEENDKIWGSCEHYKTRTQVSLDVLNSMSAKSVEEKWDQKFVIVASQKMRSSILFPQNLNTDSEITCVTYSVLERIARARYFGEMNSGKYSLSEYMKDSGLLHYQRNILLKYKLVVKQQFQQRVKNVLITGTILHLPRFFKIYRPQSATVVEKVIEYLKAKPNNMADYDDLRNLIGMNPKNIIKILKSNDLLKLFDHDLKFPYRTFYPNAPPEEYNFKSRNIEKSVNAVKLLQPSINIYDIWMKDKDDEIKEECGFLDNKNELVNVPLLKQAYDLIKSSKEQGLSQTELGTILGLSKLNSRSIIRNLERMKYIVSFSKDVGRQRVNKYILKIFNKNEKIMTEEVNKLLQNVSSSQPSTSAAAVNLLETLQETLNETACNTSLDETLTMDLSNEDIDNDISIDMTEKSSVIDNIESVKVTMKFSHRIPGRSETQGITFLMKQNKVTDKVVRRMNLVLETIKVHKVMDFFKLMAVIREKEDNQKLTELICRKSLLRLLHRMAIDRFINVVHLQLVSNSKEVSCQFFSDPSVTSDYYDWNRVIEEEKLRHFVPTVKSDMDPVIAPRLEEIATVSRTYNCPKFIRMKMFHELLFYLIYDYPENKKKIPIDQAREQWKKDHKNKNFDDIDSQITCVYQNEINWKMFIPELMCPPEYGKGWAFLRDVIHRIPLEMFVKLILQQNPHPKLNEYLSHPIKRYYLLHFLPQDIRESLMARRKFIFTVDELCRRLCFAGLLQFGYQKTKTKDDIFIYLNRNASIWDTTSSEAGYMEVSKKKYPITKYYFKDSENVKEYWTDMFTVCTNTRLNKRSTAVGKELLIETLSTKPAMIKAMELRDIRTAQIHDNGDIPGDHLGAGGLDKSFHSHMKQNWSKGLATTKRAENPKKNSTRKMTTAKKVQKKYQTVAVVKSLNPRARIIRKVAPIKKSVTKKVVYDSVDKEALKLMKTLRVQWSQVEDNTLIMSKVAITYLFPNANQISHFVNSSIVRDILHFRYKQSANKTSRACQRRLLYITKSNSTIRDNIALYLEELRSNKEFTRRYPPTFVENLKKYYKKNYERFIKGLRIHLTEMIFRIHQIFFKFSDCEFADEPKTLSLPKDLDTFYNSYTVVNPSKLPPEFNYKNPTNVDELETRLLSLLIHSAICSVKDKTNYTVQLFEIYKNYKDSNLTAAVGTLRQQRIIAMNKITQLKMAHGNMKIVPFSFAPYHLSMRYQNQIFTTHFHYTIFSEYFANIVGLSNVENALDNQMEITSTDAGLIIMLCEFILSKKIQISYKMPDKCVSINPNIVPRNQPNLDQLNRFQDIIKYSSASSENIKLRDVKKTVSFNQNDEKYSFEESPFEFFMKVHQEYSHIFCVLQKFIGNKQCIFKDVINLEALECISDSCVLKHQSKFNESCLKIAEDAKDFIILVQEFRSQEKSGSHISKECQEYQFLCNFEIFLAKSQEKIKETLKKDNGTLNCKALDINDLLEAVKLFNNTDFTENMSWITDYAKKYSNDEDDFDDALFRSNLDAIEKPNSEDMIISRLSKQIKGNEYEKKCSLNDMFVVNFSKFYTKVLEDPNDVLTFDNQKVLKSFLPFSEEARNDILNKIREDSIWKTDFHSEEDLNKKLNSSKFGKFSKKSCFDILNFVEEKKHMGALAEELLDHFKDKQMLKDCVNLLINAGYLMRSGFDDIVFVHWKYAVHWVIKTYNLLRSDKESGETHKQPDDSLKRKMSVDTMEEDSSKKMKITIEDTPSTSKAAIRAEARKLKEHERELDQQKNRETILIRPCPWIRINGSLNRRVLDRWLATIVIYLLSNPGIMLNDIFLKFTVVSPCDLRYLLEILELIGSVELKIWEERKITLFTEDDNVSIGKATLFDKAETTFVETCENAIHKLSFLIGFKKYKTEFL